MAVGKDKELISDIHSINFYSVADRSRVLCQTTGRNEVKSLLSTCSLMRQTIYKYTLTYA